MSFLSPLYLLGLFGLVVPIVIHLWSNKEGRVIKVGSIKFFPVKETKRSRSVKINEVWLLVLRTLMISIVVLLLAKPLFYQNSNAPKHVVLVERPLLSNGSITPILDSLSTSEKYEVRLLEQGFPLIDESAWDKIDPVHIDYWQLLNALDHQYADSVTVFSLSKVRGFRGKRSETPWPVQWFTIPDGASFEFLADAYETSNGLRAVLVNTSEDQTQIQHKLLNENGSVTIDLKRENGHRYVRLKEQGFWVKVKGAIELSANIWYDTGFVHDSFYLEAALKSIEQYFSTDFTISRQPISTYSKTDSADFTIWLSEHTYNERNTRCLIYEPDELSPFLIEPVWDGLKYRLTRHLSSDNVFEMDLVAQLLPLITDTKQVDSLLALYDERVQTTPQTEVARSPGDLGSVQQKAEAPYILWIIFSVLFLAERGLSFIRKQ